MSNDLFRKFEQLVLKETSADGDAADAMVAADYFLDHGNMKLAASAYDLAYGRNPNDPFVRRVRGNLLDELAIKEHGLHFRYVPAGTFLMGADDGDPDERPVHPVGLGDFWVTDVPLTWSAFADLLGYTPTPQAWPIGADGEPERSFMMNEKNKMRYQYCETETNQALDWHAHLPEQIWRSGDREVKAEELFGRIPRDDPSRPFEYNVKPVVAVSWQEADELADKLTTASVLYHLPTEAQWEKAARGGLVGQRYSWGSEPPTSERCDCNHFGDWYIQNPLLLPPNGYGIHAMCGGVWEWTQDDYDALAYRQTDVPESDPDDTSRPGLTARLMSFVRRGASAQGETQRVLRGGSWADCPAAVTVSYRMSRSSAHWRSEEPCDALTPTIGFRLFRTEQPSA